MSIEGTSKAALWLFEQSKKVKSKKQSKPVKLIITLFLAGFALVLVAVVFFSIRKQGRLIAKLKHERDVKAQEEERKKLDIIVAEKGEELNKLFKEIEDLAVEQEELLSQEIDLVDIRDLEREKIDAIENWKDVDDYLASRPNLEDRIRGSATGKES